MRKVTEKVCQAFIDGRSLKIDNTVTNGTTLTLHGNVIARRCPDGTIEATMAGWGTVTTRERLNGLCELLGLSKGFYQRKGCQYFGSEQISTYEWVALEDQFELVA